MYTDDGSLVIYWWHKDDNSIGYRCRGHGSIYASFYNKWILTSSYRSTGEDFPWDFFVFDDLDDHERLIKDYPNCVFEDN